MQRYEHKENCLNSKPPIPIMGIGGIKNSANSYKYLNDF